MVDTPSPTATPAFGVLLRTLRMRNELTQEELAVRAGLSVRGISDLERGVKRHPRRDTVALLLEVLKLSSDEQAAFVEAARSHPTTSILDGAEGRLPVPLTPLIGRDRVLAAIGGLIDDSARLVTLVGPGGVGKTRLALAVAHQRAGQFPDGAVFIDLAPVRDPALVLPTISATLGLRDAGDRSLDDLLAGVLRERRLLMVIDNVEQVVDAAPQLAQLLVACPGLMFLVTSRVVLRLSAEHVVPVPSLDVPNLATSGSFSDLAHSGAVAMFELCARAADPAFALTVANATDVAALVGRLDGLPLAIELAAARVRALPPAELLARINHQLPLLAGGSRDAPARQRTMRDAIAWSHDLLAPEVQALLCRLAVFVGGFTLEAAEAVAGAGGSTVDGVVALVESSMLQVTLSEGGVSRYHMLETVREFGHEQLAIRDEIDAARHAHAAWALAFIEPAAAGAFFGPLEIPLLDRCETELGNLRAALEWSIEGGGDVEIGLRLGSALWWFWITRGGLHEGGEVLARALAREESATLAARAEALWASGHIAVYRPAFDLAETQLLEALALFQDIGDADGVARVRLALGSLDQGRSRLAASNAHYAAAAAGFEAIGDTGWRSFVWYFQGINARLAGDFIGAKTKIEAALVHMREIGFVSRVAMCIGSLGSTLFQMGQIDQAETLLREALEIDYAIRDRYHVAEQLVDLALTAAARGDGVRAARLYAAAAALRLRHGTDTLTFDRERDARFVQTVRELLGDVAFADAWSAGGSLSIEAAVSEALGGNDSAAAPGSPYPRTI